MTDKNVVQLEGMNVVLESLQGSAINFDVYSDVRIEPTDKRFVFCVCEQGGM